VKTYEIDNKISTCSVLECFVKMVISGKAIGYLQIQLLHAASFYFII
jgi:hypothetical protein